MNNPVRKTVSVVSRRYYHTQVGMANYTGAKYSIFGDVIKLSEGKEYGEYATTKYNHLSIGDIGAVHAEAWSANGNDRDYWIFGSNFIKSWECAGRPNYKPCQWCRTGRCGPEDNYCSRCTEHRLKYGHLPG